MSAPQLECRQLTYCAGQRTLVDAVTLAFEPGAVTAIIGPNGAGKSTLLSLLAGDLKPSDGETLLDGRPVASFRASELALRRAVLPQQTILQFAFTARQVVAMGRSPHVKTATRADDDAIVAAALEQADAAAFAERTYPTLSGGEQARVNLARVLAQAAPLVLLDEPTASLDIRHQVAVMEVARDIAARGGTCIAVLHDLNLAATWADRVVLLDGGRVAGQGRPHEVLNSTLLSQVFRHSIAVRGHPQTARPLILPSGGPVVSVHWHRRGAYARRARHASPLP